MKSWCCWAAVISSKTFWSTLKSFVRNVARSNPMSIPDSSIFERKTQTQTFTNNTPYYGTLKSHSHKRNGLFIVAFDENHNSIHPPSCLLVAIVLLVILILTCDKRNDYYSTKLKLSFSHVKSLNFVNFVNILGYICKPFYIMAITWPNDYKM